MGLKNVNFKQLLVEKGERIGLVAGLGVMGLLFVGFLAGSAVSEGPQAKVDLLQDLKKKAQSAYDRSAPPEELSQIPPELNVAELKMLPADLYACNKPYFQLLEREDRKWRMPKVLGPTEFQVDLVRGSVQSYYVFQDANGRRVVGLLAKKNASELTADARQKMEEYLKRLPGLDDKTKKRLTRRTPQAGVQTPRVPGVPGATPGVPPGAVRPPLAGQSGMVGREGGAGDAPFPGPAGLNRPGVPTNVDSEVRMVPEDQAPKELTNAKLAETWLPVRMVEINAAFPYKAQLENFRQALRLNSIDDLFTSPDLPQPPLFSGFNVQRRAYTLDGKPVGNGEWEDLDFETPLRFVLSRMKEPEQEDPALESYGIIVFPNRLVLPRPKLAHPEQRYPDVKLAEIEKTRDEMEKALKSDAPPPEKPKSRFEIGSIFDPPAAVEGTTPGGRGEGGEGPVVPGNPRMTLPPRGGIRPEGSLPAGDAPGGSGMARKPGVYPEYCLVRFIDVTVQPGYAYEYQIQIKMLNPAYRREDKAVSRKVAQEKEVEGVWTPVIWKNGDNDVTRVTVGDELQYYVYQDEKGANGDGSSSKPAVANQDQAYVQVFRWLGKLRTKPGEQANEVEVGDWTVLEKRPVHRGEYVGKWEEVEVPVWITSRDDTGFAVHPDEQVEKRTRSGQRRSTTLKHKGVPVDFASDPLKGNRAIVVDFEGGERTVPAANGGKPAKFTGPVEMLILTADGKLVARNSHDDMADKERKERFDEWSKWLASVRNKADNPTNTGRPDIFQPGGGKPKSPGG